MLSPRESATRERQSLDGLWRFAFDTDRRGRSDRWWADRLPGTLEVPVPASFNAVLPGFAAHHYIGDVWYQRLVRVPRGWDGERIVLRVDAATHRAVVWVGAVQVAEHEGGYTPFEADVTEHVRPGEQVLVTVVVNTELHWDSIPPGFVQRLEDGRLLQQYFHDFFNYAGLHRSVWLHATPRTYVEDVTVTTTDVEGQDGVVAYRASVAGDRAHTVRAVVRDAEGAEVAQAEGPEGTVRIPGVRLWRPGAGYLYTLEVAVLGSGGDVVSDLFDVLLINRYYGWYVQTGDLVASERLLEAELRQWAQRGKPIVIAEYGADTQPGLHSLTSEPWSEEFQVDLLAMYHRVFDRVDAVVGEHIWNFADFATRSGISRVDGNKKGVFTRDRRPKASAHLLRQRWRGEG